MHCEITVHQFKQRADQLLQSYGEKKAGQKHSSLESRSAACRKDCAHAKSATTAVVESDMPQRLHSCMQVLSADSGCPCKEKQVIHVFMPGGSFPSFFPRLSSSGEEQMFGNSVPVEAGIEIVRYLA